MYVNTTHLVRKIQKKMDSPLFRRFLISPIIFLIIAKFISFFMHVLGLNDNMYFIILAMLSVPVVLYMVIG
jgi:hypothetical protein